MKSDLLARLDALVPDVEAFRDSARADLDTQERDVRDAADKLGVDVDPSKMPDRSDVTRLDSALAHLATVRMHVAECRHDAADAPQEV